MSEFCLVRIMAPSTLWEVNHPNIPQFATDVVQKAVAASGRVHSDSEVSLVLSDDRELRLLNAEHRGIDKVTNVLAFLGEPLDDDGAAYTVRVRPLVLGDIVIAYECVEVEAREQGKTFNHHLAHLLVHGALHLCRYDHDKDADAERMESLERKVLAAMGIRDPYAELPPKGAQPVPLRGAEAGAAPAAGPKAKVTPAAKSAPKQKPTQNPAAKKPLAKRAPAAKAARKSAVRRPAKGKSAARRR
jgi:probable rRNA maturation factor